MQVPISNVGVHTQVAVRWVCNVHATSFSDYAHTQSALRGLLMDYNSPLGCGTPNHVSRRLTMIGQEYSRLRLNQTGYHFSVLVIFMASPLSRSSHV